MSLAEPVVHLVDNDPQVLKAVGRLLAAEGIRTEASASTQEFLDRYDASVPGCVVLDLAMPGGSGLDLQQALHDSHVDVPIVFLSGQADVPSSVRAMKDGALDFLVKPVDGDELISAVRRGIARDEAQRAEAMEDHALHARLDKLTPRGFGGGSTCRREASRTRSARLRTASFSITRERWTFTVFSTTPRSPAICLLSLPETR